MLNEVAYLKMKFMEKLKITHNHFFPQKMVICNEIFFKEQTENKSESEIFPRS